jgi:tetratricopeptide (TPR) repeat protein
MQNIVHRDLKPSNILFRDEYTPVLTDFGIARQTDQDHGLTQTGHIIGTLQYMSPEQIRGMQVDHRSDIYSLGLMFYRLLVGQLPFTASGHYELSKQQCEDPPPPLPPEMSELQPIMDGMLAKHPDDRFQTALEFCKAVQALAVTNQEYATELTQQTRVFDSGQMSYPSFRTQRPTGPGSGRFSGQGSAPRSGVGSGVSQQQSGTQRTGVTDVIKKPYAWGPVLAIVLGITGWVLFGPKPGDDLSEGQRIQLNMHVSAVNGHLFNNQLDDALGSYELAKNISAEHEDVVEAGKQIAQRYYVNAETAITTGDLQRAQVELNQALEFDPENELFAELSTSINDQLAEQKRQADIAQYLSEADNFQRTGRWIEPEGENAYFAFKKVLELDPVNVVASRGLNDIQTRLVDQVRTTLSSGDLALAQQQITQAEQYYQGASSINDLKRQLAERQRFAAEEEQVTSLLQTAATYVQDGVLIDPDGSDALEAYTQVLTLRPDNIAALAGLDTIASRFQEQAAQALAAEDFVGAAAFADNGLLAVPDQQALLSIRTQATSQMGAQQREIQETLQRAQELVQSGNFLPPGDNALDTFRRVEELDPGNDQADRGLAQLPNQVFEEISQLRRFANLAGARDLAMAAQTIFADDSRFGEQVTSLNASLAEKELEQRLEGLLAQSKSLIDSRPLSLDIIDQAAKALADIRTEFPQDTAVNEQTGQLINNVAREANRVSEGGNEETGFLLIDRALTHFDNNSTLAATRRTLEQSRQARIEAERARIVAMTGQLAIDALPWGEVVEIRDSQGSLVNDLPSSRVTPMIVSLLEGNYTVKLRADDGNAVRDVPVSVVAQQVVTASENFNSLNVDDYFERSNW